MTDNVVVLSAEYAGAGATTSLEHSPTAAPTLRGSRDYHLVLHESHRCIRDPSVQHKVTIPVGDIASKSTPRRRPHRPPGRLPRSPE